MVHVPIERFVKIFTKVCVTMFVRVFVKVFVKGVSQEGTPPAAELAAARPVTEAIWVVANRYINMNNTRE